VDLTFVPVGWFQNEKDARSVIRHPVQDFGSLAVQSGFMQRTDFGSGDQSPGFLDVLGKFLVADSVTLFSVRGADVSVKPGA